MIRMRHLLVTNDFPPKFGGIQSYLWELWRRLPAESTMVLTTDFSGAEEFDAAAPMVVKRAGRKLLLPTPKLFDEVIATARHHRAQHIVLDPAFPLGLLGPFLQRRGFTYSLVLHGAEVTIPGRIFGLRSLLSWVLRRADHVISAGNYPLAEAQRCVHTDLPATVIPPGVDVERFRPRADEERASIRKEHSLPPMGTTPIVFTASRHVPRKGIDTLIDACADVAPGLGGICLLIASGGRQKAALQRRARRATARSGGSLDVRFIGRVDDTVLSDLYATSDLNATLCRSRWFGLEQEGFGIIFLEGGASGVASLAGDSGGSSEAITDGVTGAIVPRPVRRSQTVPILDKLLRDRAALTAMGVQARQRTLEEFDYDLLAKQLEETLARAGGAQP